MPERDMEELDLKVGRPVASYSLEDLRRLFLRGAPLPEAAPAPSDALPGPPLPGPVTAEPMTSLDEFARGQMMSGSAAPMPPPPAPRPSAPRTMRPVMPPPPAPSVAAAAPARAAGDYMPFQTPAILPGSVPIARDGNLPLPPVPAGADIPGLVMGEANAAPVRLDPVQLARALKRYGSMEMDPASFAARYARTQR